MADNEYCDIGVYFRKWLLSLRPVYNWVHRHNAVIDTVDSHCECPLIWYSRAGGKNSGTLVPCGGGLELVKYDIEVVATERLLSETRYIAEIIRLAANEYDRGDPFGSDDFKIQMIEVDDVNDRYEPKVIHFLQGICWTAMAVEISPILGLMPAASSSG